MFFFIQLFSSVSVVLSLSDWIVCISTVVFIGVCIATRDSLTDNFIHWIGRRIVGSYWSSYDRLLYSFVLPTPLFSAARCAFRPVAQTGWKLWDKTIIGLLTFTQARATLRCMCLRE